MQIEFSKSLAEDVVDVQEFSPLDVKLEKV